MSKMESGLPFALHTSDVGQFAIYAGSVAILLVCLLSIQVALARLRLMRAQNRKKKLQVVWRDVINHVLVGEKTVYPKINKGDVFFVLDEFDYVFGVIRGHQLDAFRASFNALVLPVTLKKLLRSRNI